MEREMRHRTCRNRPGHDKRWIHGRIDSAVRYSPKGERISFTLRLDKESADQVECARLGIVLYTSMWEPEYLAALNLQPDAPLRVSGGWYFERFRTDLIAND